MTEIWPNSQFFENFDQNRNFFENLGKFDQNRIFFENVTNIEIFRKFWPKSNFFSTIWLKSKFVEDFDQNRNFFENLT